MADSGIALSLIQSALEVALGLIRLWIWKECVKSSGKLTNDKVSAEKVPNFGGTLI